MKRIIALSILLMSPGLACASFSQEEESHLKKRVAFELKQKEYVALLDSRDALLANANKDHAKAVSKIDEDTIPNIEAMQAELEELRKEV